MVVGLAEIHSMSEGAAPPNGRPPSAGMVICQLKSPRLIASMLPMGYEAAAAALRISLVRLTHVASRGAKCEPVAAPEADLRSRLRPAGLRHQRRKDDRDQKTIKNGAFHCIFLRGRRTGS